MPMKAMCPICGSELVVVSIAEYTCPTCGEGFPMDMVSEFWKMDRKERRLVHARLIDALIGNYEKWYGESESDFEKEGE